MPDRGYERLSAQDASFLLFEGPTAHMHIGGLAVFERGSLAVPGGGVDVEKIRAYIGARLHRVPRYRQKLAFIPFENHPVWVDEARLNLNYHVRHVSLPRPGDERQLRELCGRVTSQKLDRSKPLWEAWVIEGLQKDQFALLIKTHHCVVDGISGVDLLSALLSPSAEESYDSPPPWEPHPVPSAAALLVDEVLRGIPRPSDLTRTLGDVLREPERVGTRITETVSSAWKMIDAGLRIPAQTPLNKPISPFRRFGWLTLDMPAVKDVKNRLGGTVNDVVLATVTGAVRRFLKKRRTPLRGLQYRAVVPVSVRPPGELGKLGNQVSAWMLSLPVDEANARRRFARICAATADLKRSKQAEGMVPLARIADFAPPLLSLGVRAAVRMHPYNLIVSNVPGPPFPLYLLGARLLAGYPLIPLFEHQGLAVALLSYSEKLFWGFNADWDLVPDLGEFIGGVAESFGELIEASRSDFFAAPRQAGQRRRSG
jgi:WS/DGAT/MGAT family acyltransferase